MALLTERSIFRGGFGPKQLKVPLLLPANWLWPLFLPGDWFRGEGLLGFVVLPLVAVWLSATALLWVILAVLLKSSLQRPPHGSFAHADAYASYWWPVSLDAGFWRIHLYTRAGSFTGSVCLTLFHLPRSSIAALKLPLNGWFGLCLLSLPLLNVQFRKAWMPFFCRRDEGSADLGSFVAVAEELTPLVHEVMLPLFLETCSMILAKSVSELIMAFFGISAGRRAVMGSQCRPRESSRGDF